MKKSSTYIHTYIGILGLLTLVPSAVQADSYAPPAAVYAYHWGIGDTDGTTVSSGNGWVTDYGTAPNPILGSPMNGDPELVSLNYNIGGPNTTFIAQMGQVQGTGGLNDQPVLCGNAGCSGSGAGGASFITYYFTVVGNSPGSVTVIAAGQSDTQASGSATTAAQAVLYTPSSGQTPYNVGCVSDPFAGSSGQCGSNFYALSGTAQVFTAAQLTANPNLYSGSVTIGVTSTAGGEYQCSGAPSGNCTLPGYALAFIDPYISIAQSPGDTLLFSAGITNAPEVSAAPEPTTLALTGAALFGLVGIQRKRNRKP